MIHRLGLGEVEPVGGGLKHRNAAADAELEAAAAQLIDHADLFDQAERMIERQQIDQRPEAQFRRALRQRCEDQRRRGGGAERRRVMFGDVIAVEAGAIVSLGDGQPLGVELAERHARVVDVVEDAEFHAPPVSKTPMAGTSPAITNL